MTLKISLVMKVLRNAMKNFGDIPIEIQTRTDPEADTCAIIFLPPAKSQTSMPWTPNIYCPHGAIFSQN